MGIIVISMIVVGIIACIGLYKTNVAEKENPSTQKILEVLMVGIIIGVIFGGILGCIIYVIFGSKTLPR